MPIPSRQDRAQGAIVGSLIGDALGLGCHWYYDMDAMRRDCGAWVDDYRDSDPERSDRFGYIARLRHANGVRAGDGSQTAQIAVELLESVVHCGGYQAADFTARLDRFFTALDGTDLCGRFTDRAVRETWAQRRSGIPWGSAGSDADTAEAAIWNVVQAAHQSADPRAVAVAAHGCASLTHANPYIAGYSTAFVLALSALIDGVALPGIRRHVQGLREDPEIRARTSSNDIAAQIGNEAACMGADPDLGVDAGTVCRLLGMNCTIGFQAPSAYFLIHRFPDDFERAVLTAVNAGGNNMARAALTGALSGALVGLQGIPRRLIDGLTDHARLLDLSAAVTAPTG